MANNPLDLHPERLATTDENGSRVFLYPADVSGIYRRYRTLLHFVFLLIFLGLPWLKISGKQAVLLDISNRNFEIFGLSLRAHNAPLVFFVFAIVGFGLFFVTSVFGRVWCGWACPQTVFVDFIYRRIERMIEGPAHKRRQQALEPMTFGKFLKLTTKWILFVAVTLIITHSFMAYFVGTDRLREIVQHNPTENWSAFLFMLFVSAVILFDFAWFREQFCTIMCPYGRFQSVLMDPHSLIVAYDPTRGEPRATPQAKLLAKNHGSRLGDCVNCYRCVQVCPVGIDIRRGTQMECIACTGCMDACDEIMTKVNRPKGLIRYDSQRGLAGKKRSLWRLRPMIYLGVVIISIAGLIVGLSHVNPVDVEILRSHGIPYTVETAEGTGKIILNHFDLTLKNQEDSDHQISVRILGNQTQDSPTLIVPYQPIVLKAEASNKSPLFIKIKDSSLTGGKDRVKISITDENLLTHEVREIEQEVVVVGPII